MERNRKRRSLGSCDVLLHRANLFDVPEMRVDKCAHGRRSSETLPALLGELDALGRVPRCQPPVAAPALELGEMHELIGHRALIANRDRLRERLLEPHTRAGEVVDVLEPLCELGADTRAVDALRRARLGLERAL